MASIFLEEIDQGVLVLLTEARQTHVGLPLFQVDWPGACDALLAPLHVDAPDGPPFLGRRSHFRDGGSPLLSALSEARIIYTRFCNKSAFLLRGIENQNTETEIQKLIVEISGHL